MRDRAAGHQRVTYIELFFDLVFVFAVTQLSHYLLNHRTLAGALEAALLLAMMWQLWAYTTWLTNWVDPDRMPTRLLLLGLTLVSLAMSAALPLAFADSGVLVGCSYAVLQVGRSGFAIWALRGNQLAVNFERILAWCCVSGTLAILGGVTTGVVARALLWLGAVAVDLLGGFVGFYVPGLGRTPTTQWTIEGGHFAERCQAFILIAIGESIVVTGLRLTTCQPTGSRGLARSMRRPSSRSWLRSSAAPRCGECISTAPLMTAPGSSRPRLIPAGWADLLITSSIRSWWLGSSSSPPPTMRSWLRRTPWASRG